MTGKKQTLGQALSSKPSREVAAHPEPSPWVRSKDGRYLIQWQLGRITCSCKDFRYSRSVDPDGTCKHIDELSTEDGLPPEPEDGGTPNIVDRKSLGQALTEDSISEDTLWSETDDNEPLFPVSQSKVFPIQLSELLMNVDQVVITTIKQFIRPKGPDNDRTPVDIVIRKTITPTENGFSLVRERLDKVGNPRKGTQMHYTIPGSEIIDARRFGPNGTQYMTRGTARLWTNEDKVVVSHEGTSVPQDEFLEGLAERLQT